MGYVTDPITALLVIALGVAIGEYSTCEICGSSLSRGGVVRCRSCRTPHHADCWEFNPGCSTYACGGRECR